MPTLKILRTCLLAGAFFLPTATLFAEGPSGAKLTGKIETLPNGNRLGSWVVAGRTVQVTAQTNIETENGPVSVGACVDVRGTAVNATTIAATSINTQSAEKCNNSKPPGSVEIFGAVELLPTIGLIGDWRVAGTIVRRLPFSMT